MSIVPSGFNDQITFFEQHIDAWTANAAAIGLTAEQATQMIQLTTDARDAYNTALAAREASKVATASATEQRVSMRDFGGDLIATIKAFAEASDNPTVYQLAQIPAPAQPVPLGPPAVPRNLSGSVDINGAITINWEGSRTGGTTWIVQRQTAQNPEGPYSAWTMVGAAADRSFTDSTLPTGIAKAAYQVKALRGGGASTWSGTLTMGFGVVSQGEGDAQGNTAGGGEGLSLAA